MEWIVWIILASLAMALALIADARFKQNCERHERQQETKIKCNRLAGKVYCLAQRFEEQDSSHTHIALREEVDAEGNVTLYFWNILSGSWSVLTDERFNLFEKLLNKAMAANAEATNRGANKPYRFFPAPEVKDPSRWEGLRRLGRKVWPLSMTVTGGPFILWCLFV